jgi:hypothetical protein
MAAEECSNPCQHVVAAIAEAEAHGNRKLNDWALWRHTSQWLRRRFQVDGATSASVLHPDDDGLLPNSGSSV